MSGTFYHWTIGLFCFLIDTALNKIMRNISIGQIIIILLLGIFLFSDFSKMRKKITVFIVEKYKIFNKKFNRKKGSWTPDLWFWKPLFYQLNYFPFKNVKPVSKLDYEIFRVYIFHKNANISGIKKRSCPVGFKGFFLFLVLLRHWKVITEFSLCG